MTYVEIKKPTMTPTVEIKKPSNERAITINDLDEKSSSINGLDAISSTINGLDCYVSIYHEIKNQLYDGGKQEL